MADKDLKGIPSHASIAGHPLHPLLIPFPIAFLIGAFLTDLAYLISGNPFFAYFSINLIGAGVVMGLIGGLLGAIDFFTIGRVREHKDGWIHAVGNVTAVVLSIGNWLLRVADPLLIGGNLYAGVIISVVVAGILGVTGWYGGELVYRWLIGIFGSGSGSGSETVIVSSITEEEAEEEHREAA